MINKHFLKEDFVARAGTRREWIIQKDTELDISCGDHEKMIGVPIRDYEVFDTDEQYAFPNSIVRIEQWQKVVHCGDVWLVELEGLKELLRANFNHTGHGGLALIGKMIDRDVMNLNDLTDVKAKEIYEQRECFGW